jgi:hypothetical protein
LEEAVCSALSKGLNYAVTPAVVPVDAILCGVEKATGALPEETAKEDFLVVYRHVELSGCNQKSL